MRQRTKRISNGVRKKGIKKQEETESKIFSVILVISLFIITFFLIISNLKIAQKRKILLGKIESLKSEIQILEKRNQELKSGIKESQTQDYWEEKMREQGYKKPGETAVVIKKEEQTEETKSASKNIWEKFLAEIKGIF